MLPVSLRARSASSGVTSATSSPRSARISAPRCLLHEREHVLRLAGEPLDDALLVLQVAEVVLLTGQRLGLVTACAAQAHFRVGQLALCSLLVALGLALLVTGAGGVLAGGGQRLIQGVDAETENG